MGGDGRDGRGAQRGVEGVRDDRLGRPTPERFYKSRVSKQGSVSGKTFSDKNLNKTHHLLATSKNCCLQKKVNNMTSVYCKTAFHVHTVLCELFLHSP